MLNFEFLEKGLGKVSPPHFAHVFSRKMFLMMFFKKNCYLIALLLKILVNMCIAIAC